MMWAAVSSNSLATAKLKMQMLPAGFAVALCNNAIQSCDRHSNRSFLLRIDFVVAVVDVLDVSVSEIVAFPPTKHFAFSSIVLMHRQILVAVEEVFGWAHQQSNEEPNVCRSVTVQLVKLNSRVFQVRRDRKA